MKEYTISISPRILELLGPNLYTNIYYVLAELIANAYDADARNVYIISNSDDIRVEDDGHGMSYNDGDIKRFLDVAKVSRSSEADSLTLSGSRKKMGRKGVGKLAALSVSENVAVLTSRNDEKSGFILSRHPNDDKKLDPIPDDEIHFDKISGDGTAIVMRNPQYRLHKTLTAVKRNLLKIFPLVNNDFRIHIIRGKEEIILDSYDENIATELSSIITLGDPYKKLICQVPNHYPPFREDLVESRESYKCPLTLTDNNGDSHEYVLEIEGWIGTYKTTRGRKAEVSDFPDNFISLYANNKMGEFNILPIVGQNKLNEVYVVGQLFVDLFEKSELPDMSLSNRQGYKSDDPRYIAVVSYVRETLLPDILKKREKYADISKQEKKKKKLNGIKDDEAKLRQSVETFKGKTAQRIIAALGSQDKQNGIADIVDTVNTAINENMPELGLKSKIDSNKKRILISHTYKDKPLADIVFQMLLYNNVPSEDIIYTNCDDEICRIPEGVSIYDYLRDFFVESYSTQKIYVLFITSENTQHAWGAMSEIGAAWITQVDNKIFNIPPFTPKHPLDDEATWHSTDRDEHGDLSMSKLNADIFCHKIEHVCDQIGYSKRTRADNKSYLATLVTIK